VHVLSSNNDYQRIIKIVGIPESQLETWAHQGATVTAKATHESIRNALESDSSPIKDRVKKGGAEIYLQGSYKNDTNIRGDSDVDLVVELNTVFGHNAHELPPDQKRLHDLTYENATYSWEEFRADVITAVSKYYGPAKVDTTGNKSIKLLPVPGRLKADIVPAVKFRKYSHFRGRDDFRAKRGIRFYHRTTKKAIVNFPHHHFDNGKEKNSESRTNGWFKPTVRIFKNARSYLIEKNLLADGKAPSYFLQSLIYNVPDKLFGGTYQSTFYNLLKYWCDNTIDRFVCQNEVDNLFDSTKEQWNLPDAKTTIRAMVQLWNDWQ